ncbi:aldo/keto reductase, partial [Succinimonas sp.]|uniref:aldo/keto reductase n=1 Tax=Succinimonas sp. TaxID=1936151 RepID=UPI0038642AE3
MTMEMRIGKTAVSAAWEQNEAVSELMKLAAKSPLTIKMSMYGGFEQVGSIGHSLPRNDRRMTAQAGDIMLYSGNQLVVFYGSNSWAYTKLGRITGQSQELLKELLSNGDVTVTLSAGKKESGKGAFDFSKKTVLLNSGYEMPVIGLGTWALTDNTAEEAVYQALKSGMRLIDTARYYGNEVSVGRGLKRAISEGIVTREEVFITGKIYGGNYERAGRIINDEIRDLNVDYIDLLLIHQPGSDDAGVYKAMEEAVNDHRIRSLGISNYYTREAVDKVLSFATIKPAVIQNENHLYYQNTELQKYVRQYGIVIESWYPFGGRGHTAESFGNEIITELAGKYGKTPAQ